MKNNKNNQGLIILTIAGLGFILWIGSVIKGIADMRCKYPGCTGTRLSGSTYCFTHDRERNPTNRKNAGAGSSSGTWMISGTGSTDTLKSTGSDNTDTSKSSGSGGSYSPASSGTTYKKTAPSSASKKSGTSKSSWKPYGSLNNDPDDFHSPEDFADEAWGDDFDDWDEAYDYWEDNY